MEKTLLVVEDDKDVRDFVSVALSVEGWSVKTTESLLGALHILKETPDIHCMLLDYNLPGMPMEDFLKQAAAVAPTTRIILISAADRVAEKAKQLGIERYLPKPLDLAQLRSMVK